MNNEVLIRIAEAVEKIGHGIRFGFAGLYILLVVMYLLWVIAKW